MLSHAVDWHVVPGRMPADATARPRDTIALAVRYAPSSEPSLNYLRAAATALDAQRIDALTLDVQTQDAATRRFCASRSSGLAPNLSAR